jgi:hypothetical protein
MRTAVTENTESVIGLLFPGQSVEQVRQSIHELHRIVGCGPVGRLAGLDELAAADPRDLIRRHRGQVRLHLTANPARYRPDIVVSSSQALAFYDHGVSVNLENAVASFPVLGSYIDALSGELGIPRKFCFCAVFISAAGGGLPTHFDNKEVIVVQIGGRKQWRIAENTQVSFPTANYAARSDYVAPELARYFRPENGGGEPGRYELVDMQPGSVLFLPRGYWHGTRAEGVSVSLSFGFAVPTWEAVFAERLRDALVLRDHWRAPALHMGPDGGRFLPDAVSEAMDRAIAALTASELDVMVVAESGAGSSEARNGSAPGPL